MNKQIEKICAGHYLVHTSVGQFSVVKHGSEWIVRSSGHLIEKCGTKKEAIQSVYTEAMLIGMELRGATRHPAA